jgi:hypothetical protein
MCNSGAALDRIPSPFVVRLSREITSWTYRGPPKGIPLASCCQHSHHSPHMTGAKIRTDLRSATVREVGAISRLRVYTHSLPAPALPAPAPRISCSGKKRLCILVHEIVSEHIVEYATSVMHMASSSFRMTREVSNLKLHHTPPSISYGLKRSIMKGERRETT